MFEIVSKKRRKECYVFQNEDGTQRKAEYFSREEAERMLSIIGNEYYIREVEND